MQAPGDTWQETPAFQKTIFKTMEQQPSRPHFIINNLKPKAPSGQLESKVFHYVNELQALKDREILAESEFKTLLTTSFHLNNK